MKSTYEIDCLQDLGLPVVILSRENRNASRFIFVRFKSTDHS